MIVTFCGHACFYETNLLEQKLLSLLEDQIGNHDADLYLGGYGAFDEFAYHCGKKYKEKHPNVRLIWITPYIRQSHSEYQQKKYDEIIYPAMENVSYKYAISHRNKWMIINADLVIAYIDHNWGGAFQTFQYARRKGKKIFNLADVQTEALLP